MSGLGSVSGGEWRLRFEQRVPGRPDLRPGCRGKIRAIRPTTMYAKPAGGRARTRTTVGNHGPCSAGQGDCDPGQCASASCVPTMWGHGTAYRLTMMCAKPGVGVGAGSPAMPTTVGTMARVARAKGIVTPGSVLPASCVPTMWGRGTAYRLTTTCAKPGAGMTAGGGRPGHVDYCRDYGPVWGGPRRTAMGTASARAGFNVPTTWGAQYGFPRRLRCVPGSRRRGRPGPLSDRRYTFLYESQCRRCDEGRLHRTRWSLRRIQCCRL